MKLFLILMRRLYLVRLINSFLCFLSVTTSIFLTALAIYYEQIASFLLVPLNFLWWLLIIPALYLSTEIGLLKTYRLAIKLDKDNLLPYTQVNQKKIIIFEHEPGLLPRYQVTMIGNPMSFFDPRINFLEAKTLIKSRSLGIVIGLLTFILILTNIFLENIATASNFAFIILMIILLMEKVCIEDLKD